MSSPHSAPTIRLLVPAWDGLRTHARSIVTIAVVLAVAGAVAYPVAQLASPRDPLATARMTLPAIASAELEAPHSQVTRVPAVTQQRASDLLFGLACSSGIAILLLGAITGLTVGGARTASRSPEFALRLAVGGSRRSLLAAVSVEGLFLAASSLLITLPLAVAINRLVHSSWPGGWGSGSTLLVAAVPILVAGCALASVILPFLVAPRPRLSGEPARPLTLGLPIVQMALSLIILLGGGLMIRHARTQTALAAAVPGGGRIYAVQDHGSRESRSVHYRQLLATLSQSSGFTGVSLTSSGTTLGLGTVEAVLTDCGDCAEGMIRTKLKPLVVTEHLVSPDTFKALGTPVLAGRPFTLDDDAHAPPVAIVTRSLAQRGFQYGEALGREIRIRTGGSDATPDGAWFRVVGIVEDRQGIGYGVGQQPSMGVFLSVLQRAPEQAELLLRGDSNAALSPGLLAPLQIVDSQTETDLVLATLAPMRWFGGLFTLLGWALIVIGTAGSVVIMRAWLVALLPELGLRRAVGARRRTLVSLVLLRVLAAVLGAAFFALWVAPGVRSTLVRLVGSEVGDTDGLLLRYAVLLAGGAIFGILTPLRTALRSAPGALLEHAAE